MLNFILCNNLPQFPGQVVTLDMSFKNSLPLVLQRLLKIFTAYYVVYVNKNLSCKFGLSSFSVKGVMLNLFKIVTTSPGLPYRWLFFSYFTAHDNFNIAMLC